MSQIYTTQNLSYEINNRKIIREVTCSIEEGITVIKGPNGAGKTTFLKLLFGMMHPTSGKVVRHFNAKNTEISFVFQEPIFLNRSVEDNLKHVLYCKSIKKKDWNKIIYNIVTEYSLEHVLKSQIKDLSGGELQLLSLIRSMIIKPSILLYDEPTNNLDGSNIELVTKIIKDINNQGLSLIMVSHSSILDNIMSYNQLSFQNGSIIDE
ncbi:MAG: ABC transporter ATP-binding protein [Pseudomonadota bacterium]|nr:ABC transporter ATP-binding protein [Pseudomonadota bacterium]